MITFLADNNDGMCRLSVTRMCEIFARSRESIVTSIASLEKDGQIGVDRKDGMPSSYWPLIPAALAELSANPVWFVEALSTKPKFRAFGSPEEAIAAATQDRRSTPPDQSGTPDQSTPLDQYQSGRPDRHRSTLVDELVNSSRQTGQEQSCSISLINSLPISQRMDAPATAPPADAGSGVVDPAELQFEEFWAAFPAGRKRDKGGAHDLFRQIVTGKHKKRRASAATLIDAAKRYAATKPDPEYTPMPTTWLNGGRWMDDLSGQAKRGSKYDAI
jgi:hypothetical protein